jgi:hypothetical protein
MRLHHSSLRGVAASAFAATALLLAACGGDDDDAGDRQTTTAAPAGQYAAVKRYLLEHTTRLVADTTKLRADTEAYHALAARADFDYAELLETERDEARASVRRLQADFRAANPAYEEMEGVVAGVPELADFDVIIDAGGDASDPENAVPFSITTDQGRTFKQPGNFFFLAETSIFGTEERFTAKGVEPDLDGDGKVEFGEALPDADFLLAVARDFERSAKELDAAARKWTPEPKDVFTALVVMTPTMSEYFEAWKNSRFVAGSKATERSFVGASRLQDIADILGGLVVIYDNVRPQMERAGSAQAAQTGEALLELRDFAAKLRDEEAGGRTFTAEQAETLGSDAQEQAEAIAGQVSQAAGKLGIELQEA